MQKRKFDELISYFNRKVSEMEIGTSYKMELLGMVTALGYAHEKETKERKTGRWIPCSEKLPEQYGNYLVSYKTDPEPDIGTFVPKTGLWTACDANGCYWIASKGLEVIAWQSLPEPWKDGEEG